MMADQLSVTGYSGLYVNLDRSRERRSCVEGQLERYNLAGQYRRFTAVDGALVGPRNSPIGPPEIGCFLSHHAVAQANQDQATHLHVVEDDVLFCDRTRKVLLSVIESKAMEEFDIIYTDLLLPLEVGPIGEFKKLFDGIVGRKGPVGAPLFDGFTVVDLRDKWFAGSTSYLLNKCSVAKFHGLLTEELQRGPRMPLDLYLQALIHAGMIRGGCVFPFVTSVKLEHTIDTTMSDRHTDQRPILATNIVRQSFFIDCDWEHCRQLMEMVWTPKKLDAHEQLISAMLNYKLFGDYKTF